MRLDGVAEATTPDGESIRYENAGVAIWTAYSRHGDLGGMAWLDHHAGNVVVKNPDDEMLSKMREIALALGAKVQGDEGELFDDPPSSPRQGDRRSRWMRRR